MAGKMWRARLARSKGREARAQQSVFEPVRRLLRPLVIWIPTMQEGIYGVASTRALQFSVLILPPKNAQRRKRPA